MKKQQVIGVVVATGTAVLAVTEASAASLVTTDMATSIGAGFTDFKDTVVAILTQAFPFIMGIIGVLAAPSLVKKMVSIAKGR